MIQHTVCFTLSHAAGSAEEADFLSTAADVLPSIPGVTGFRIARQVSPQSDFAWQFSMDFDTDDSYVAYNGHPDHQSFVQNRWVPEVADFQEFDFVPLAR